MMDVALIDYGSGNLHSAERALRTAAQASGIACHIHLTDQPDLVRRSDRVVLPGVGHFAQCAAGLRACEGMVDALEEAVRQRAVPFLGICVGLQLLADRGLEDGETAGLGWIHGDVDRIEAGPGLAIPHMGWNELSLQQSHPVLNELGEAPHVYFTHSYAMKLADTADLAATADYGAPITAAIARENMFGTQFHPEKSQRVGLKLLSNFLAWNPV